MIEVKDISRRYGDNAAAAFTTVNPGGDLPSAGAGLAVFAGYLVVLFGAAAALLVRRDA